MKLARGAWAQIRCGTCPAKPPGSLTRSSSTRSFSRDRRRCGPSTGAAMTAELAGPAMPAMAASAALQRPTDALAQTAPLPVAPVRSVTARRLSILTATTTATTSDGLPSAEPPASPASMDDGPAEARTPTVGSSALPDAAPQPQRNLLLANRTLQENTTEGLRDPSPPSPPRPAAPPRVDSKLVVSESFASSDLTPTATHLPSDFQKASEAAHDVVDSLLGDIVQALEDGSPGAAPLQTAADLDRLNLSEDGSPTPYNALESTASRCGTSTPRILRWKPT